MDRFPLEAYVALPWTWRTSYDSESECWVVTIDELPDFFAAGSTEAEAGADARDALISHLEAYLAVEKPIPAPRAVVASVEDWHRAQPYRRRDRTSRVYK